MNLLGKFGMVFLITINIVFVIFGIALMAAGIAVQAKGGEYLQSYLPLLDNIEIGNTRMGFLLRAVAGMVIATGIFSIVVSLMGIVGACKRLVVLLIIYGVIIIVLLVLEITVLGVSFQIKQEFQGNLRQKMLQLIQNYEGDFGSILTTAWNFLFLTFQCCGVNQQIQVNDFISTLWWQTPTRGPRVVPTFCCKGATPDSATTAFVQPCTLAVNPATSYVDRGCYDILNQLLDQYTSAFIAICILIVIVQIIAAATSFILVSQIRKEDKEMSDKN
ncbi:tetraspanin-9-like [Mytilus edulis]|uniref:tetraspanin-9-like n=1 Tax=Mytilus trossulus TaxID=6551 RepID=UPI003006D5D5